MAREFSSIKVTKDLNAIDSLLSNQGKSSFEMKVYKYNSSPMDGMLSYPEDLFLDPAHQCLMRIEVFENQESFLQTTRNLIATKARDENSLIGKVIGRAEQAAGIGAFDDALQAEVFQEILQGQGFVKEVAGILKNGVSAVGQVLETQVGGVVFGFEGGNINGKGTGRDSYTEEQTGLRNKDIKRVAAIYLYMPTGLETDYGMNYDDENMAGMDNLKLKKALGRNGSVDAARDIAKRMALSNTKILDRIGEAFGIEAGAMSKFLLAKDRQVVNPMTLHLFKDVKRREFSFSYTFIPRSEHELHTIYKILQVLKYYSHPKRSEGSGRFLDYPAEFQISFVMPNGKLNEYLPIIHKCVLTNIKVRYGEDAVFSTIEVDKGGAPPTKLEVELSFSELEILTRERFADNHTNGHAIP